MANKVSQASVYVQSQTPGGVATWASGDNATTLATGVYDYTTGTIKNVNVNAAGNVYVAINAKKIFRNKNANTVTVYQGQFSGFFASPGDGKTLGSPPLPASADIDLSTTFTYADNAAGAAIATKAGIFIDPTYSYVVTNSLDHTGTLSFSDTGNLSSVLGSGPMDVQGLVDYADGSETQNNGATESIFGTTLSIDSINVEGLDDAGNPILSGGEVSITDGNGNNYLHGTLTNIIADPNGGDPIFQATIGDLTLGDGSDSGLDSQLLQDWDVEDSSTTPLTIYFDPSFIANTTLFSKSEDTPSFIEIAPVPEPSALVLLATTGLWGMMSRRQRAITSSPLRMTDPVNDGQFPRI